ncbi:MAG TPA: hypothetical protein VN622_16070 [Clostridia bacterium]|nr:hypothetical protein [Clostridia bacterium]
MRWWHSLAVAVLVVSSALAFAQDAPSGTYTFLRDSDGGTADVGVRVTISFTSGVHFAAVGSGTNLIDNGTYSVTGNLITISLPSIGKSAKNRPFTLTNGRLTLPFKVFSETIGTSTWKAQTTTADASGSATGSLGDSGSGSNGNGGTGVGNGNSGSGKGSGGNSGNGKGGQGGSGSGTGTGQGGRGGSGSGGSDDPGSGGKRGGPAGGDGKGGGKSGKIPPSERDPKISPYVGDWVAMGWGWEVRFKSSQLGGVTSNKNIMTLMVKHLARMNFTVDKAGNIAGRGMVTYDLDPNLCGVHAVATQVNQAINMMAQLPDYMEAGANIAKRASDYFSAASMVEESNLAVNLDRWKAFQMDETHRKMAGYRAYMDAKVAKNYEVTNLAQAVWEDRCTRGIPVKLAGALTCDELLEGPIAKMSKGIGEVAEAPDWFNKATEKIKDKVGDMDEEFWSQKADALFSYIEGGTNAKLKSSMLMQTKNKFDEFFKKEKEQKGACEGGSTLRAGTRVGGMDAADAAGMAGSAAATMATGGNPMGMIMNLPGVTQVQYDYKGLQNGAESRSFKLKGRVVGDKMFIEMDGDVYDGDKDLTVEYTVNYKTERKKFPAWSPFEVDGAGLNVRREGPLRILERKVTYTTKTDKEGKKYKVPHEVTTAKDTYSKLPFATLHKSGQNRNKVKVWHEYEYFIHAHRVTEPMPK